MKISSCKQYMKYICMYTYMFCESLQGFPGGTMVKNLPANAGDATDEGLIPASWRFPGVGNGNPFQFSCLENSVDRGVWPTKVHGIVKSQTWLSDWVHTRTYMKHYNKWTPVKTPSYLTRTFCYIHLAYLSLSCPILAPKVTTEVSWISCYLFPCVFNDSFVIYVHIPKQYII